MCKTNLYEETVETLKRNGKKQEDIKWAGCKTFKIPLGKFWEIAKNTNYDSGYGGVVVAVELVLVGDDFWLSRGEYDGSEWWNFNKKPEEPKETRDVYMVTDYMDC